jgi:hypothetical protein
VENEPRVVSYARRCVGSKAGTESILAAGIWRIDQKGCEVPHFSLSDYSILDRLQATVAGISTLKRWGMMRDVLRDSCVDRGEDSLVEE